MSCQASICCLRSLCLPVLTHPSAPPCAPQKLRVLIVGAGGREHALAWKLAQSVKVTKIFVAPGKLPASPSLRLGGLRWRDERATGTCRAAGPQLVDSHSPFLSNTQATEELPLATRLSLSTSTRVTLPPSSRSRSRTTYACCHRLATAPPSHVAHPHLSPLPQVNLVIPGPEQPLVDGIENSFRKGTPAHAVRLFDCR